MHFRRVLPATAAALAAALLASGCASNEQSSPRTITKVVTATDTAPATGGSNPGITVVDPSASGSTGATGTPITGATGSATSGTPSTTTATTGTATSSTATTTSTSPVKKVDPTTVSCGTLLDSTDIKKALGAKVSTNSLRIVDVKNPDVKMTARIKCYYGTKNLDKAKPVAVALAQYASAGAAQSQLDTTVASEKSLGAKPSTVDVSGKQADVLLRDGGFLILRYDTWTLSIATADKFVPEKNLPEGLQKTARMVLARTLASASAA